MNYNSQCATRPAGLTQLSLIGRWEYLKGGAGAETKVTFWILAVYSVWRVSLRPGKVGTSGTVRPGGTHEPVYAPR